MEAGVIEAGSRNLTYLWRDKFYQNVTGVDFSTEPIFDWANNLVNISRNCDFNKECCSGCTEARLFDLIVFCMRDGPEKGIIRQKFCDGAVKNLQDLLAFLSSSESNRLQSESNGE